MLNNREKASRVTIRNFPRNPFHKFNNTFFLEQNDFIKITIKLNFERFPCRQNDRFKYLKMRTSRFVLSFQQNVEQEEKAKGTLGKPGGRKQPDWVFLVV